MSYSVQQLPSKRWGIYSNNKLLATHGCQHTCLVMLELLKERKKNSKTYQHSAVIVEEAA